MHPSKPTLLESEIINGLIMKGAANWHLGDIATFHRIAYKSIAWISCRPGYVIT